MEERGYQCAQRSIALADYRIGNPAVLQLQSCRRRRRPGSAKRAQDGLTLSCQKSQNDGCRYPGQLFAICRVQWLTLSQCHEFGSLDSSLVSAIASEHEDIQEARTVLKALAASASFEDAAEHSDNESVLSSTLSQTDTNEVTVVDLFKWHSSSMQSADFLRRGANFGRMGQPSGRWPTRIKSR